MPSTRHFRLFWMSESLIAFCGTISGFVLPLVAIATLDVSVIELALLTAIPQLGYAVLALPAGAWVDRLPRWRVMIITDIARAAIIGLVPLAMLINALDLWVLYLVGVLNAVLQAFYEPAWHAYLPTLVERRQLVAANGRLQSSTTAIDIGGKGLGGLLVQLVGPPLALLVNTVAFVLAAVALTAVHTPEPAPEPDRRNLLRQIGAGLRLMITHEVLRILALFLVLASGCLSAYYALSTVFLARTVGLPAGVIGLVFAAGGLGGVIGGLTAHRISARIGTASWLRWCTGVTFPFGLLIPLTQPGWGLTTYIVGGGLVSAGVVSFNVMCLSLTQATCPTELLGRVHSVIRLIVLAGAAAGSALGGVIGEQLGVRPALWIIMAALLVIPGALLISPLRRYRDRAGANA